jgi:hypothetical protein
MLSEGFDAARYERRLRLANAVERHGGCRFGTQAVQKPARLGITAVTIGSDGRHQQSKQRYRNH